MSDHLLAFALFARSALAGILLWSGTAKQRQLSRFIRLVEEYRLLPSIVAPGIGRVIPVIELVLGGFLLLGLAVQLTALCVTVMLLCYSSTVGVNLTRHRLLPCMCFGKSGSTIGWWTLYRNSGLLVLSGLLVFRPLSPLSVDAAFHGQPWRFPAIVDVVLMSSIAMAAFVLWLLIGEALHQ